ncbi:MAG: hypothetical protein H7Y07_12325, partial [Pyrinomonadaceae bacterium]|nr:hypothetical protein [Sphingobacteriaceae bacterium]
MDIKIRVPVLLLIFSFSWIISVAQTNPLVDTAFNKKLDIYTKSHPADLLFVHVDKTIYTNNESIWFSAYLIKTLAKYANAHTILSVALMREDNKQIVIQDKYVMQDGLSFGSIILPDTIAPGNYQFIASTNVLDQHGKSLAVFTQPLTLKSITQRNFNANISLLDTVVNKYGVRAKVTIEIKDIKPKEKTNITYRVGRGIEKKAHLKAGENEYLITIPKEQLTEVKPVLLTSMKYNNEVIHLSTRLPEVKPSGLSVRFFPEGGNMVAGLESNVGWEVKNAQDLPLSIRGTLHRNNELVKAVSTNSYGGGTFKITPDGKSRYSVKIAANSYLKRDTVFMLPEAIDSGVVLHTPKAIVNDTLQLTLFSKGIQDVKVRIHNYCESFASFRAQGHPTGKKLNVILGPEVPKGIAVITILDQDEKPLAERLFFAHHNQGGKAEITPDKKVYGRKEKVVLKLKLTEKSGTAIPGIVSVACVQDNRIESIKQQDIVSYVYLKHDLAALNPDPLGRGIENKDYLETMLMIKGWRRYTWQNLINTADTDTLWHVQSPVFKGVVHYLDKPLKKPSSIVLLRDSLMDLIETQNDGSFELSRDNLLIPQGRKLFLTINGKDKDNYTFKIVDPLIQINQKLAEQMEIINISYAHNAQSSKDQELKGLQKSVALRDVVIKAVKNASIWKTSALKVNACGDYVCSNRILNCLNHMNSIENKVPVQGEQYRVRMGNDEHFINKTYYGCVVKSKSAIPIASGIYTSREFYGVNMDPEGLLEIQFLSTLFWKPGLIVNNSGEAECTFYTGDITGKFRIVVQGVSDKDMIFGSGSFTVK